MSVVECVSEERKAVWISSAPRISRERVSEDGKAVWVSQSQSCLCHVGMAGAYQVYVAAGPASQHNPLGRLLEGFM